MAKKCYVGVDGVARQVKKGYVGIDGVARKIKKAYIGIGGVARLFWSSGGTLRYYSEVDDIGTVISAKGRKLLAATSVGNYALFAGGYGWIAGDDGITGDTGATNEVSAINKSFTRSVPTALKVARQSLVATTIGNYALFGGGISAGTCYSNVDAYNTSLTRSTPSALRKAVCHLAAITLGDYALFGGGYDSDTTDVNTVTAYNASLTRSSVTGLRKATSLHAAAAVGNYALFNSCEETDVVTAYDTSLTRLTTAPNLSVGRHDLAATSVGNYALFAGGIVTGGSTSDADYISAIVDAYDSSLTRTNPTNLRIGTREFAATSVGDFAIFAGGHLSSTSTNKVTVYDSSLTRVTTPKNLQENMGNLAATTLGDYALFGGGMDFSTDEETNALYVYVVE